MNNFIYEKFDAIEIEYNQPDYEDRVLIRGHLKTGGAQTIVEVLTENFDSEIDAENVANHIFNLISSDLENYEKYKYLDQE